MDIKNARDLSKIITLCRKKGVQTIKVATDGSIELTLSDALPVKAPRKLKKGEVPQEASADAPAKEYTDEEVLMWSVPTPALNVEEN